MVFTFLLVDTLEITVCILFRSQSALSRKLFAAPKLSLVAQFHGPALCFTWFVTLELGLLLFKRYILLCISP